MQCLNLLLNHGTDVRKTFTMELPSAVSFAAANNRIDALECLLSKCVDDVVNGEKEKLSPLHYASFHDRIYIVLYIVEKYPCLVHLKASADEKRHTSFHLAAGSGNVECMKVLLDHGAKIETVDTDGSTALFYAARNGKPEAVQFLHDRGASAVTANQEGCLPLHDACHNGHVEVARFLLQKHPEIVDLTTSKESGLWTPLHMAAQKGSVDCIKLLLQCKEIQDFI